jgi:signal transduction histidine kinase
MNSLTRFVGFSVLLLVAFLVAALGTQSWLQRQARLLRTEVTELRRTQFAAALRLLPRPVESWDEKYLADLSALVGATITTHRGEPPPFATPALLYFDFKLEGSNPPTTARVTFQPPPSGRLLAAHQRVLVGLLLFGGVLMGVGAALVMLTRRAPAPDTGTRSPWQRTRAEMGSFEQLAKTSVAQRQELDHERDNRRRAEQDAQLNAGLLSRSIEERIGLGRDLHDGIIQSLYAVGLTLESVRGLAKTNPEEADQRLERCCENLNSIIREVRTYITGLAPENVHRATFIQTLDTLFRELGSGCDVKFDVKVDDEATALLSSEQATEALQIVREAVSNAIRHGGASFITVRVHKSDREVCLLVQDNGTGFDATRRREGGHGLGNMQARAQRVGANTSITSKPGEGTRVVVTLTMNPLATA